MTETHRHTRSRLAKVWRLLAAMAAVTPLVAACASDVDDSAPVDRPPVTTQPAVAVGTDDGDPADEADGSGEPGESTASADGAGAGEDTSSVGLVDGDDDTPAASSDTADSAETPATAVQAATLRQFGECDAVLSYVQEHATAAVGPWGLGDELGFGGEVMEEGAFAPEDATAAGFEQLQPGVDYSTSNVQEAGIDEPDVLKTDGRRMLVATENWVQVVDVTGPEPALTATLDLGHEWGWRLLLHGDRALGFASEEWDSIVPFVEPDGAAGTVEAGHSYGPTTKIVEIDLARPVPVIVRRLTIEGHYLSARMTDGVVRVITVSHPRAIRWAIPEGPGDTAQHRATAANRELIADTTLEHWFPHYALSTADGQTVTLGRLAECDRVWAPVRYSGPGTLSVTTVDITRDGLAGPLETTTIMSDGSTVYASPEHLYVTTTEWSDRSSERAGPGDGTPAETEIHMFDMLAFAEHAFSPYVGSALVPGTLLNQYSMSEHEGHLRIATTTVPPWRPEGEPDSQSLVTVFAVGDDGLYQVGQVSGLGVGERIYAVRYLGDIAAVVTFRQTDPLYIIDLSDSTLLNQYSMSEHAPAVLGELKITGYSAYLHPLGDDLLLGVGQEATEEGVTVGTQVSLFDISDRARPERVAQWTAPGGHSHVEFNALAFLHWPPSGLAVLPLNQYAFNDIGSEPPFVGAVALSTAGAELTERARFSHAGRAQRRCYEWREFIVHPDGSEEPGPWERSCVFDTDWQAQVTASAVVGDRLYLASNKALESISLDSLERVSLVTWAR